MELLDAEGGRFRELQALVVGWSGRVDPTGTSPVPHLRGSLTPPAPATSHRRPLNKAREVSDQSQRRPLQGSIDKWSGRRNLLYLYHQNYIVAYPKN